MWKCCRKVKGQMGNLDFIFFCCEIESEYDGSGPPLQMSTRISACRLSPLSVLYPYRFFCLLCAPGHKSISADQYPIPHPHIFYLQTIHLTCTPKTTLNKFSHIQWNTVFFQKRKKIINRSYYRNKKQQHPWTQTFVANVLDNHL